MYNIELIPFRALWITGIFVFGPWIAHLLGYNTDISDLSTRVVTFMFWATLLCLSTVCFPESIWFNSLVCIIASACVGYKHHMSR